MARKFLAVLLCVVLVLNICAGPAAAVETSEAQAVEVYGALEEAGISVMSLDAGAAVLLSSGAGAGAVAVAPAIVPVVAYIAAMGVAVYGVYHLAELAVELYGCLSEAAQLALQEWAASGNSSTLSLDDVLASELASAFELVFFSDDGAFATMCGLSFDASTLPVYSIDYFVNNSEFPVELSEFYSHELSFGTSIPLGETGLTARLINASFSDFAYALEILNTATGVSCSFGFYEEDAVSGASSFRVSLPTVEIREASDGSIRYGLKWFILAENIADADYPYQSFAVGDGDTFVMEGLPNFAYNGDALDVTLRSSSTTWQSADDVWEDDVTPGMYVAGTAIPLTQDDEYADVPVAGDVLYIPTDYADVDAYTSEFVRTGTTTADPTPPGGDGWSGLWEWLKSILDTLKSILDRLLIGVPLTILDAVKSLVDMMISVFLGFWNVIVDSLDWLANMLNQFFALFSGDEPGIFSLFEEGIFESIGSFFTFVQEMYNALPPEIRAFIEFSFSAVVFFGLFKMLHG